MRNRLVMFTLLAGLVLMWGCQQKEPAKVEESAADVAKEAGASDRADAGAAAEDVGVAAEDVSDEAG